MGNLGLQLRVRPNMENGKMEMIIKREKNSKCGIRWRENYSQAYMQNEPIILKSIYCTNQIWSSCINLNCEWIISISIDEKKRTKWKEMKWIIPTQFTWFNKENGNKMKKSNIYFQFLLKFIMKEEEFYLSNDKKRNLIIGSLGGIGLGIYLTRRFSRNPQCMIIWFLDLFCLIM